MDCSSGKSLDQIATGFDFGGGMICIPLVCSAHRVFVRRVAERREDDGIAPSGVDVPLCVTEDDLVFVVCRQLERKGAPLMAAESPGSRRKARRRISVAALVGAGS